uniref:CSON011634 protein n=1 Tax=Culicoides sonorensis TaxID=179676 RepID=A0A336KNE6_CULSO
MYAKQAAIDNDKYRVVDLRSDTLSVPTEEMRRAMFEAEVGDDVYGEDPTVKELERKAAEMFGKEAALFVPSGTMGNLLAIMVHCSRRGSEAITGNMNHTFLYEQGGAAQIAGVSLNLLSNKPDGTFCLEQLKYNIRGFDVHEPKTALVLIENTHNMCGGKVLPMEWLKELSEICKENGLKIHMDGARVFCAAEFLGVPVSTVVKDVDSVCFCLSKNLSCPIGSILLGKKDFITEAHRLRKVLGGGMRQVGVIAAAGIVALDQVVPKLKYDHLRAKKIAQAIYDLKSPNFCVDIDTVQTNIFMIQLKNKKVQSNHLADRLKIVTDQEIKDGIVDENGKGIVVKPSSRDWSFIRLVLYLQIDDVLVDLAIRKIVYVLKEFDQQL